MHAAQHKKRQRIGKRIVASLSAASNQKPKKNKLLPRTMLQFLNFPFPPPIPPHTQNKNSRETKNRMKTQTDVRHNRQKERGEKQKNNDQILSRKVSLLLSRTETAESPKTQQRRVRRIEVGVENECITTSYYNSGGTRRQELLPLARAIDSTTTTTVTQCRVMSSHKSENQSTHVLVLLPSHRPLY